MTLNIIVIHHNESENNHRVSFLSVFAVSIKAGKKSWHWLLTQPLQINCLSWQLRIFWAIDFFTKLVILKMQHIQSVSWFFVTLTHIIMPLNIIVTHHNETEHNHWVSFLSVFAVSIKAGKNLDTNCLLSLFKLTIYHIMTIKDLFDHRLFTK